MMLHHKDYIKEEERIQMSTTNRKRGHNKGILQEKKARKRIEAEERNSKTLPGHTRSYRRLMANE